MPPKEQTIVDDFKDGDWICVLEAIKSIPLSDDPVPEGMVGVWRSHSEVWVRYRIAFILGQNKLTGKRKGAVEFFARREGVGQLFKLNPLDQAKLCDPPDDWPTASPRTWADPAASMVADTEDPDPLLKGR